MELSKDSKDRLQKVAKVGITAAVIGGVAVKIFRRENENSWGYAHLTHNASLFLGAIVENTPSPKQFAGKLRNSGEEVASGAEPNIDWDEGQDEMAIPDLEHHIINEE